MNTRRPRLQARNLLREICIVRLGQRTGQLRRTANRAPVLASRRHRFRQGVDRIPACSDVARPEPYDTTIEGRAGHVWRIDGVVEGLAF